MNKVQYTNYELKISSKLLSAVKDFTYEYETNINDFIIEAIIEKFNAENDIFNADIDKNGFISNDIAFYFSINSLFLKLISKS